MIEKKTILILDDEVNIAQLVKHQLEAIGYLVVLAKDGVEGLIKLKTISPDLIVMDVNMPKMGGIEFYREITDENGKSKCPVLVLTTRANLEEMFKDIHVAGFMPKPFLVDDLIKEIERILTGRKRPVVFLAEFEKDLHLDNIGQVFEKEKYDVVKIIDVDQLLNEAGNKKPNCIIFKYKQGNIGADIIVKKIKEHSGLVKIPIIIYSFSDSQEEEEATLKAGADRFLRKPENYGLFLSTLLEIESGHKTTEEI